jgi:murein DD-endopeptidase MepM/ murein hydrolase activator NlpD
MADEHASITLTLTDEMSEKLAAINAQLETMASRFGVVQQQGSKAAEGINEGLGKVREPAEKIPENIKRVEDAFSKFVGGPLRSQIVSVAEAMGRIAGASVGMEKAVGAAAARVTELSLSVGRLPAMIGLSIGGFGALAYGVLRATEAIGRAYAQSENLRVSLGETSDEMIESFRRAGDEFGRTGKEMEQDLSRLTTSINELRQGMSAPLAQELISRGAMGLLEKYNQMIARGASDTQVLREYLKDMGRESEQYQREMSRFHGIEQRELAQLSAEWEKQIALIKDPAVQQAMRERLQAQRESLQATKEWNEAWVRWEPTWIRIQTGVIHGLNQITDELTKISQMNWFPKMPESGSDVWKFLFGETPLTQQGRPRDLDIINRMNRRMGQPEVQGPVLPPNWTPPGGAAPEGRQRGGAVSGGAPYVVGEAGPELFVPRTSGNVLASASGGPTSELREVAMSEREGNVYLREMRDILDWIRQQMEEGGGGKGAGPGGGAGDGRGPGGGFPLGGYAAGGGGMPRVAPGVRVPSGQSQPQTQGQPGPQWPEPPPAGAAGGAYGGALPSGAPPNLPWFQGGVVPGPGAASWRASQGLTGGPGGMPAGMGVQTPEGWGPGGSGSPWPQGGVARTGSGGDDPEAGTPPGSGATGLAGMRARYAKELQNPATMQRFLALSEAEVGGQGEMARQAFMETVMNRGASRGLSLEQMMRNEGGRFFPSSTTSKLGRTFKGDQLTQMQSTLGNVVGGSDVTKGGTGNYSVSRKQGWYPRAVGQSAAGLGGGPVTYVTGRGEYIGMEQVDVNLGWQKRYQQAISGGGAPQAGGGGFGGGGATSAWPQPGGPPPGGTPTEQPQGDAGGFPASPITGTLGQGLGAARGSYGGLKAHPHAGWDIMAPEGTPVHASLGGGTIVKAEFQNKTASGAPAATGGIVTVRYDNGIEAKYMHLSNVGNWKAGQRVNPGQVIGLSGYSPAARSSGAHLHLEYRDKQGNLLDAAKVHGWGVSGRGGEGLAGKKVSSAGGGQPQSTDSPYAPGAGAPGFAPVPFTQEVPGFSVGGAAPPVAANVAPEPHEQAAPAAPPMTITGPRQLPGAEIRLPRARPPQAQPPMMTLRDRHEDEDQKERKPRAPMWTVNRGQSQVSVDGAAIDRSIAGQVNQNLGRAEVNVKFDNMPRNAKASANGDGIFKEMNVSQTRSMAKTGATEEDGNQEE